MKSALLLLVKLCAVNILVTQFHCAHGSGEDGLKPRIVGGLPAEEYDQEDDLHGIVSLQVQGQHFCGGTWVQIGNVSRIVTAAHCFFENGKQMFPNDMIRIVGDDLSAPLKFGGERRQVNGLLKVVGHPKFKAARNIGSSMGSVQYDIAVLFLTKPFKETSTFRPMKLSKEPLKDNQKCRVAGWGNLQFRGQSPKTLQYLNITVIPQSVCNAPYAYGGAVPNHAFCAGIIEGGGDSCQGDSGGGVLSNGKLVGVVSFGVDCGRRGYPGVYTNTQRFNEWIYKTFNASPIVTHSKLLMLITVVVTMLARTTVL